MRQRTVEPLLWLFFSAGGVLAALVLPILVLLFGLAMPLGWLSPPNHDHLLAVFRHPLTRIALTVFIPLVLLHAAHRLRFTLYDGLQIKHLNEIINVLCYGGAAAGTIIGWYLVWSI